jgi:allophanate hydrolase subunit 1
MKLEKNELSEVLKVVETYGSLQVEFASVEEQMEKIKQQKDDLLNRLEEARKQELLIMKKLEKKHGPGKLNLDNYEYIKESTVK